MEKIRASNIFVLKNLFAEQLLNNFTATTLISFETLETFKEEHVKAISHTNDRIYIHYSQLPFFRISINWNFPTRYKKYLIRLYRQRQKAIIHFSIITVLILINDVGVCQICEKKFRLFFSRGY